MNGAPLNQWVYFIKPVMMDGPVKIGCSTNPAKRLLALVPWAPFPLEVAAEVPGNFVLEKRVHACFAASHFHHEWFHSTDKLRDTIRKLKEGVPIENAIDLTLVEGAIRGKRQYAADVRLRMSYFQKLRHAELRAEKATGERRFLPNDASEIRSRWGHYMMPRDPSPEQIARLNEVILDPVAHCISYEEWCEDRGIKSDEAAA